MIVLVCRVLNVKTLTSVLRLKVMQALLHVVTFLGIYYTWNRLSMRLTCRFFVR